MNNNTIRTQLLQAYEMWPQVTPVFRDLVEYKIDKLRAELAARRGQQK